MKGFKQIGRLKSLSFAGYIGCTALYRRKP